MGENKRHVQLPNSMTTNSELTPQDLLVYVSIKRFMNKDTKEAFPSLATISQKCGASIPTVRKCIARLVEEEYLFIRKEGRSHIYSFNNYKNFEPFSYEFLDKEDLTFSEKAYIIASQQYMFKEGGEGRISMTNKELADKLNISESTLKRCDKSLEKKDYMTVIKGNRRDPVTGIMVNDRFFYLNELEQAIVFTLQDHENRISNNESEVQGLKEEMAKLKKELRDTKKENEEFQRWKESQTIIL